MFDAERLARALKKIKEKIDVYKDESEESKVKSEESKEESDVDNEGGLQLCLRAKKRLETLMELLSGAEEAQRELVADDFTVVVNEFLLAMRLQKYYNFLLYWVASCQRLVAQVFHTHSRVDDIYAALGIEEDPELAQWRGSLAADRAEQESWLEAKLKSMMVVTIINQAPSPMKLKESLTLLANQLLVWPVEGDSSAKQELKLSLKQAEFMKATLESVSKESYRPDAFDWFMASEDIAYDRKNRKESPSGYMFEGTYVVVKTGERRKAAIKFLDAALVAEEDSDLFSREISTWSKLKDEHIIKMLGANHQSKPMLFVSELATAGNLVEFFLEEENRVLLWHLFIQAAQGLQYLRESMVEHGGLSCTNILLTRPEGGDDSQLVVKLSDFGMARVRTESVSLSLAEKRSTLRYEAPERLADTTTYSDFSLADTYSLGLCIIDAATGQPPFGTLGDEEVVASKLNGEPIKQPEEGFTDVEWTLVARMVDNNPVNRPSLEEVIEEMQELDTARQLAAAVRSESGGRCRRCGHQNPPNYQFCGACGHPLA